MKHATLEYRTGTPDYSDLPEQDYDWSQMTYGDVEEVIPDDVP